MRISTKALEGLNFEVHIDTQEGTVEIYPKNRRDISEELQKLTDLSRRDCFFLTEDIQDLQVIDAIKRTS